MNFKRLIIVIFILLLIPAYAWAAACTGSSPDWYVDTDVLTSAEVQSCVNNATDGDTITFDAGSATWTTNVIVDNNGFIFLP